MTIVAVGVGGAIGALLRWQAHRLNGGLPWGTLAVNLIGSALLGVLVALGTIEPGWQGDAFLGLTVGVLGGMTTFSTLMVETALPARPRLGYLGVTVLVGLILAWVGFHSVVLIEYGRWSIA